MLHPVEAIILEPFTYTQSVPGKGVRFRFIDALNIWLNVPLDKIEIINDLVSMTHDSSLMLDDIQDGSPLRRAQPAAHKVYGEAQTISAVNYATFQCYAKMFTSGCFRPEDQMDLFALLIAEGVSTVHGQGLDILWRDTLYCPSEEEYISMVLQKTGAAFRLAIGSMMIFATTNRDMDYTPLANLVAAFFQIRDDYMNLESAAYTTNKGFAEDLTEGKFSFPVIHSIHADQTNQRVLNVLEKRPSTPTLKIETIEYMRNHTKSMDYTMSVLVTLRREIEKEIGRLGGNQILESLMNGLEVSESTIERPN